MSFSRIPTDVICENILPFLEQKEIALTISIFKNLGAKPRAWKSYYMRYQQFFKLSSVGRLTDTLEECKRQQRIRKNWKSGIHERFSVELFPLESDVSVKIDPYTDMVSCLINDDVLARVIIYSADNSVIGEYYKDMESWNPPEQAFRNNLLLFLTRQKAVLMRMDGKEFNIEIDGSFRECFFSNDASSVICMQDGYVSKTAISTGRLELKQQLLDSEQEIRLLQPFADDTVMTATEDSFYIWDFRQKQPITTVQNNSFTTRGICVGETSFYHWTNDFEQDFYKYDLRMQKPFTIKKPRCIMELLTWSPDGLIISCDYKVIRYNYLTDTTTLLYDERTETSLMDCDSTANKFACLERSRKGKRMHLNVMNYNV